MLRRRSASPSSTNENLLDGFICIAARRPRPSGLGRKRRSSVLLIGIAVSPVEWLTIADVNALNRAGRRFEIAGAGGPDGQAPHVDAGLGAARRHDGAHDVAGTEARHHAGCLEG